MSVYKPKKSPFWHYDFILQGRRFHSSTGAKDKEKAKSIEAEARKEAAASLLSAAVLDISIDHAFGRYWQEHARHLKSADDVFTKLEKLKDGLGADTMLGSLSNAQIATYIARRRSEVSDASVNRETAILRAVMNRALSAWDIHFKMPNWRAHRLREPRGRVRFLTRDEEARLMSALRPDMRSIVRFCLITGARVTSARMLTWTAVDVEAGEITLAVKSAFTGEKHILPLTPELFDLIEAQRGQHPIYVFTYVAETKNPEVSKRRRKGERYPFSRDGWRRTWKSALKKAGIADFRFHDLRHTAATQMLRATKNLAAVKEVLGHRDVATTMRYAHVLRDDVAAALSRNSPETQDAAAEKTHIRVVKS